MRFHVHNLLVFNARGACGQSRPSLVDELVFDHGRHMQPDQTDQRESRNGVDFFDRFGQLLVGGPDQAGAARQTTPPGSPWPSCRPTRQGTTKTAGTSGGGCHGGPPAATGMSAVMRSGSAGGESFRAPGQTRHRQQQDRDARPLVPIHQLSLAAKTAGLPHRPPSQTPPRMPRATTQCSTMARQVVEAGVR